MSAGLEQALRPWWARWSTRAACANADPELFEVPSIEKSAYQATSDLRRAVDYCAACPVMPQCHEYANDLRLVGVWGGMLFSTDRHDEPTGGQHGAGRTVDLLKHRNDLAWWMKWRKGHLKRQVEAASYRGASNELVVELISDALTRGGDAA